MAAATKEIPEQSVHIDSGDYLIRTLTPEDASERWAAWMADPEVAHMINVKPRSMSARDIADYVKSFDQRSNLLWGVFDKQSGLHIGFFTVSADFERRRGLVNLLIGEKAFRNHGVLSAIRRQFAGYFFETLGLETMLATALAHNDIIINTLLKGGWKIDRRLKDHVTAHADGAKLELCLMSLSKAAWRERNRPETS